MSIENKSSLEEQIERVKAESEKKIRRLVFENSVESFLEGFNVSCLISNKGSGEEYKWIIVKCKKRSEAAKVLELLPAINTTNSCGTFNEVVVDRPFLIALDNSYGQGATCRIKYQSADFEVNIHLPVSEVEPFVFRTKRRITDCEYHYFTGVSMSELRNMSVPSYDFNDSHQGQVQSWYGGDKTLLNVDTVDKIIEHIIG